MGLAAGEAAASSGGSRCSRPNKLARSTNPKACSSSRSFAHHGGHAVQELWRRKRQSRGEIQASKCPGACVRVGNRVGTSVAKERERTGPLTRQCLLCCPINGFSESGSTCVEFLDANSVRFEVRTTEVWTPLSLSREPRTLKLQPRWNF